MSKNKISAEDKIKAVKLYLDGKKSQGYIASKYGVVKTSVQRYGQIITTANRIIHIL